jgi:hypothetical protein
MTNICAINAIVTVNFGGDPPGFINLEGLALDKK